MKPNSFNLLGFACSAPTYKTISISLIGVPSTKEIAHIFLIELINVGWAEA